jgi:hypothetical protein
MRTSLSALLLSCLLFAAAGCKKDYPQCETYVDLALKCDDDLKSMSSSDKKTATLMLGGMCEEAFKNDVSKVEGETKQMVKEMYAELRDRATCAAKANTCDGYAKCDD